MVYYLAEDQALSSIADAIREKTNNEEELSFPDGFVQSIRDIETSSPIELIPLTISANDTYTAPEGKAYNPVHVEVPQPSGKITITKNGTDIDISQYATVDVDVPNDDSLSIALIDGEGRIDALPNGLTKINSFSLMRRNNLFFEHLPNGITSIGDNAFYYCQNLPLSSLPSSLISIQISAFSYCTAIKVTKIPEAVQTIKGSAFYNCTGLTSITFEGIPNEIDSTAFSRCANILHMYVPWSEGEVANAPWGATNATIHYNYTEG